MKQLELKQYMFTFEEGGWNTVWGKTLRGAKNCVFNNTKIIQP